MRGAALAFTLLSLLHVLHLAAQRFPSADVGQRVRVTTDSGAWIGTLVEQDATGLQVLWAGERGSLVVTIPQDRIRRLEVSAGRRSNADKGAAIGLGVGALGGLAVGIGCANSNSLFQCTTSDVAAATIIAGFIGAA